MIDGEVAAKLMAVIDAIESRLDDMAARAAETEIANAFIDAAGEPLQ
jgi:hypothetical protein